MAPIFTAKPPSTSKIGTVSLNPAVAQSTAPATSSGQSESRYKASTYITKIPTTGQPPEPIYNGDRMWARVTLTLETAGPVAVGDSADLQPVLSGKGVLLQTGVPMPFAIAKGSKIYIAATAVNRIKVQVEAYPWLETLVGLLTQGVLGGAVSAVRKVAAAAGSGSKI